MSPKLPVGLHLLFNLLPPLEYTQGVRGCYTTNHNYVYAYHQQAGSLKSGSMCCDVAPGTDHSQRLIGNLQKNTNIHA